MSGSGYETEELNFSLLRSRHTVDMKTLFIFQIPCIFNIITYNSGNNLSFSVCWREQRLQEGMSKYLIILPGIYPHVVPAAADDAHCRCIQQWWEASTSPTRAVQFLVHVLFILLYKIILFILYWLNSILHGKYTVWTPVKARTIITWLNTPTGWIYIFHRLNFFFFSKLEECWSHIRWANQRAESERRFCCDNDSQPWTGFCLFLSFCRS